MKRVKKNFTPIADQLKVKELIKDAKVKGFIKPYTEAFEKNPTKKEAHKGNTNYFAN